jgi:Siphovirus Gp157
MKLQLYKIEQEYINLADQLIENGGELTPELEEALIINKEQLEHKGQCYGFVVKSLESDVDVIDSEIKRLQGLKKSRGNTIDRLKESIKKAMELYQIDKLETPTLKISFRSSESVEVDESMLDSKYMVEKKTYQPDKAMIKADIKSGVVVTGAILQHNNNLQIK